MAVALVAIGVSTAGTKACDLTGSFIVAIQSNDTTAVFDHIRQSGESIEGSAKFRDVRGDFRGTLKRNGAFSVVVSWDDGSAGVYTASIANTGQLSDGRTYEVGNTNNSASWGLGSSSNRLQCH